MSTRSKINRPKPVKMGLAAAFFAFLAAAQAERRADITISENRVFPESITSAGDGSVYIGSAATGTIYRAAPGSSTAEIWLSAGTTGNSVLGVLADDRRNLLWVCAPGRSGSPSAIKAFDLASKAERGSYGFEGGGGCNDMAVAKDGTVYASDFDQGRLMRLTRGDTMFRPFVVHVGFKTADGVALMADGAVYLNTFRENGLWRVPIGRDGSAGAPVQIQTDLPLVRPDGMRAINGGRALLLMEGGGRLSEVTVKGDRAFLKVLKDNIPDSPVAVTLVGGTAFLIQAKWSFMRDTNSDPGGFKAIAVPYSPSK